MRNLKKILALVLALVMTMSLVTVANAAQIDGTIDGTDEEVYEGYDEAVTVLMDMGIFKGYDGGDTFQPKKNITRAEVAALMYRIDSTDTTDSQVNLFSESAKFDDVQNNWAKAYIGYCYNNGIVKGKSATEFDPQGNITGYEVLAMILRAMGYDKNGEFTGDSWQKNIAGIATSKGILVNVPATDPLTKPATRELVAELLFRAMSDAAMVEYTPAFGYQEQTYNINGGVATKTLGSMKFDLQEYTVEWADKWGRPGYEFTYNVGNYSTTFVDVPVLTFTTAKSECDIYAEAGLNSYQSKGVEAYINGEHLGGYSSGTFYATTYKIESSDQIGKIGGQGRVTEIYNMGTYSPVRIVMIDTLLAEVVYVTPVVKDSAGHTVTSAQLTLKVYDADNSTSTVVVTNSTDWTYTVGQFLLVNAITDQNDSGSDTNPNNLSDSYHGKVATATSFDASNYDYASAAITKYDILGVAESFTGAQTAHAWLTNTHIIGGTTYNDANTYHMDKAGYNVGSYIWYTDTYGNLIGSAEIVSNYTYGVISSIQWIPQTNNYGYAQATFTLFDGSTKTAVVTGVAADSDTTWYAPSYTSGAGSYAAGNGNKKLSVEYSNNTAWLGDHLYRIDDVGNNAVYLTQIENKTLIGTRADGTTAKSGEWGNSTTPTLTDVLAKGDFDAFATASSKTGDDYAHAVMNNNTKFLFGYSAKSISFNTAAVTGIDNIPSSTTNVVADYIDVDADGYIDYVYVKGTRTDTKSAYFFYMTSTAQQNWTYTNENGVYENVIHVPGYVDGTLSNIVIAQDAYGIAMMNYMNSLYNDTNATATKNKQNVLFAVAELNGKVVYAVPVAEMQASNSNSVSAVAFDAFTPAVTAVSNAKDTWNLTGQIFSYATTKLNTAAPDATTIAKYEQIYTWTQDHITGSKANTDVSVTRYDLGKSSSNSADPTYAVLDATVLTLYTKGSGASPYDLSQAQNQKFIYLTNATKVVVALNGATAEYDTTGARQFFDGNYTIHVVADTAGNASMIYIFRNYVNGSTPGSGNSSYGVHAWTVTPAQKGTVSTDAYVEVTVSHTLDGAAAAVADNMKIEMHVYNASGVEVAASSSNTLVMTKGYTSSVVGLFGYGLTAGNYTVIYTITYYDTGVVYTTGTKSVTLS